MAETTAEKIVGVARGFGKDRKADLSDHAATKIEGKLRVKVRVTVRYTSTTKIGDTATLIVVRTSQFREIAHVRSRFLPFFDPIRLYHLACRGPAPASGRAPVR